MIKYIKNKKILSWALYDWANSAFATTVMAAFFPIFFKKYWSIGADVTESTFQLGIANSIGSIIIAVLAPILGAIADSGSARKKFLFYFAFMGIVMTGSLYMVGQGNWFMAAAIYIIAQIGFIGSEIFYDSLLLSVAETEERDIISSLGYSLGYLGGGLLFALNVTMTLKPEFFGLMDATHAVQISFITVAAWWAIFSIPVFLFVDEPKSSDSGKPGRNKITIIKEGFKQLSTTFHKIRKYRVVFLFLAAYWVYIDGVDTIIRMAVDYGMSLGFDENSLIVALLITQFVGFPAAIMFGKIGEKIGTKTGIYISLFVYIGVCIWAYFMKTSDEFYVLAVAIGLVQGGIQSLSRSYFSRIIPIENGAQFFGFYNLMGKFAAVIGPLMMGLVSRLTGEPRYSVLSVIVLFVIGAILLYFVDENKGMEAIDE